MVTQVMQMEIHNPQRFTRPGECGADTSRIEGKYAGIDSAQLIRRNLVASIEQRNRLMVALLLLGMLTILDNDRALLMIQVIPSDTAYL